MTTSTFTSPIDSDTDTDFRARGSQISAQLAAVGLTQTGDIGQINWETDAQLQSRVHAMAVCFGWGNVTEEEIYSSTGAVLDRLAWRYCLVRC